MNDLTQHAVGRMQQRCIAPAAIDHLLDFGRWERCGTGPTGKARHVVTLDRRGAKRLERYLGPGSHQVVSRTMGMALVVEEDRVITTMHRTMRVKQDLRCWRSH